MRILVTGGAGYIGTELIGKLMANTDISKIIVYDNLGRGNQNLFLGHSKLNSLKIQFVKGDILDTRQLKKIIEEIDVVYHLAARVTTPFADHNPHQFDQINNWGTSELTFLIEKSNVKNFVYVSSASVYGSSDIDSDINSDPYPSTFYGISKWHGEGHVKRLFDTDISTYILRVGSVFGYSKSMRFDSVINKLMFEANFMRMIRIYGDGTQYRPFVHIERLSSILAGLTSRNLKSDIYNVVENNFRITDIADELRKIYPDLQLIFINQNMKMRNLRVKSDHRIKNYGMRLSDDLQAFKKRFTF